MFYPNSQQVAMKMIRAFDDGSGQQEEMLWVSPMLEPWNIMLILGSG
jgi:hypothetical protein